MSKLKIHALLTEIDVDGHLCGDRCAFLHIDHMDTCSLFGAFLDLDMNLCKSCPVGNALRRLRRKIRREAGPYTQISAEQVLTWIAEELKRRKNA